MFFYILIWEIVLFWGGRGDIITWAFSIRISLAGRVNCSWLIRMAMAFMSRLIFDMSTFVWAIRSSSSLRSSMLAKRRKRKWLHWKTSARVIEIIVPFSAVPLAFKILLCNLSTVSTYCFSVSMSSRIRFDSSNEPPGCMPTSTWLETNARLSFVFKESKNTFKIVKLRNQLSLVLYQLYPFNKYIFLNHPLWDYVTRH